MTFPVNGDDIFLVEDLATMGKVISASAPEYNFTSTMCYWFAGSLMEMAALEKAGMFTFKKFRTKGKAGMLAGTIPGFEPKPSQQVPALRAQYAESWELYRGEISMANQVSSSHVIVNG